MTPQNTTPHAITPEIRELCRRIDPSREPILVPVRSTLVAPGKPFALLKAHASLHGGEVQYGWTIWEQPGWYLEAEFHGVWAAPSGELVDLVPLSEGTTSILFLPDSRRTYRGEGVPSRFLALSGSPDVQAVVQNAEMHAKLRADAEAQARRERVQPGAVGRNEPCPCGSGLKYKKCCGKSGG